MSNADVLEQLRDSLPEVHMHTPVEVIVARGHNRRNRRRRSTLATVGVAASVAAGLAWSAVGDPGRPGQLAPPIGPGAVQLAAFTVASGPDGSTVLTLRKGAQYKLDPAALRQALAEHGIPAVVTVGSICDTATESDGLDQVVSSRAQTDGSVITTFTPSAMPAGSKLSLSYFPTHTIVALIDASAPLSCTVDPGQSTSAKG
jgi:hypothetical protein